MRFISLYIFSSDLGKTWETQYLAIPDKLGALFSSIEFFDNSQVGLVCEKYSPRVMITFSGGKYWTFLKTIVTVMEHTTIRYLMNTKNLL